MFKSASALPSSPTGRIMDRLAALRRQLKIRVLVQGLSRWLWLLMLVAALDLALDWFFRFDQAQRAVLSMLVFALLTWASYRWLFQPLLAPVTDDAIALAIEQANPHLQQRLISGLQLSRQAVETTSGVSTALVQHAIQAAATLANEVPFENCLDEPRHRRNLFRLTTGLIGITLVAVSVCLATPLQTWFSRNVLLTNAVWPQGTILLVAGLQADRVLVLARGQEATLAIEIGDGSRVVPTAVEMDLRQGRSQSNLALVRVNPLRFEGKLASASEAFEFRARGGDGETPWIRAILVDPPELAEMTLTVTPPTYTGLPAATLNPGQGPYQLLPGSSLQFAAKADKQLKSAELIAEGTPLMTGTRLARGDREPSIADRTNSVVTHTAKLERDHDRLTADLSPQMLVDGVYRIELRDVWGISNRPNTSFAIERRADREPSVTLELVGTSRLVTPSAQIAFRCAAVDDFGLTKLAARLAWTPSGENASKQEKTFELSLSQKTEADFNPIQSLPVSETQRESALDLVPLRLDPPVSLDFQVEATDNDMIGSPKQGVSPTISLRVVTESEFRSDLLRRERELRAEFASIVKEQTELLTETRVVAAALAGSNEWTLDSRQQLATAQKQQRIIGERTTNIAERFERMALEIINNRLETSGSPLANRLSQQIAAPLRTLAEVRVPEAAESLHYTRLADAGAARSQGFAATITRQELLAREMHSVLDLMAQAESFQEAVNLLYEIEKAQIDVHQQTDQARQERIRRILEGNPAN